MWGEIKRSFRIGLESAKTNVMPMLALWICAVSLVLGYYLIPSFADFLNPLKRWQTGCGWPVAWLNAAFFCGILPGVFQLCLRRIRPRFPFRTILAQTLLCGLNGAVCYWFYRLQVRWFGNGADFGTLAVKMLVDQFAWTPLVIAPVNATVFFWIARDLSAERVRAEWPGIGRILVRYLVPLWIVNVIPNLALYAFPPALQIQLVGLLGAFWTLMCLQVSVRSR